MVVAFHCSSKVVGYHLQHIQSLPEASIALFYFDCIRCTGATETFSILMKQSEMRFMNSLCFFSHDCYNKLQGGPRRGVLSKVFVAGTNFDKVTYFILLDQLFDAVQKFWWTWFSQQSSKDA